VRLDLADVEVLNIGTPRGREAYHALVRATQGHHVPIRWLGTLWKASTDGPDELSLTLEVGATRRWLTEHRWRRSMHDAIGQIAHGLGCDIHVLSHGARDGVIAGIAPAAPSRKLREVSRGRKGP